MFPSDGNTIPLTRKRRTVRRIYEILFQKFGQQDWWPAEAKDANQATEEMIVGVVLTQNTNWANVERALHNLRREKVLSLKTLSQMPLKRLAELIRPAGYFNVKAQRLREVARYFVERWAGKYRPARATKIGLLRDQLLAVYGIGPESVDSILLYGFGQPSFVIDAYTLRIGSRHGFYPDKTKYDDARKLFMECLEPDVQMYNEYHALFVRIGKNFCKPKPLCKQCPLNKKSLFLDPKAAPEGSIIS